MKIDMIHRRLLFQGVIYTQLATMLVCYMAGVLFLNAVLVCITVWLAHLALAYTLSAVVYITKAKIEVTNREE